MDGEIGKQKTDAMADRIRLINPECEVVCEQTFYNITTSDRLLSSGYDFIIDAIDLKIQKTQLIVECKKRNIPLVVCGGAGGKIDPTTIQVADMAHARNDKLIQKVRSTLRSDHRFPKANNGKVRKLGVEVIFFDETSRMPSSEACDASSDQPTSMRLNCASGFGSITHMTATMGLFAAQRALQFLIK